MADQTEAPYLDALVAYVAREPGPLPHPGAQGHRCRSRPDAAARRSRHPPRRPAGHRGDRRRPGADARSSAPSGSPPRPGAPAQLVPGQRRLRRKPRDLHDLAHATELGRGHRPRPVVVQRNVHSSTIDGLVLSGLRPTFVAPEIDPELGIAHCVTPEALDAALDAEPDAAPRCWSRPPTSGPSPESPQLAEVAHAHERPAGRRRGLGLAPLLPRGLPTGGARGGADLVLSSTHKIVGSLTQSAILHLGDAAIASTRM